MKKIVTLSCMFFCLTSMVSPAQTETEKTGKQRLSELESLTVKPYKPKQQNETGLLTTGTLSHVSYGRLNVDGDSFKKSFGPSWEISMGVFDLSLNPASWLSLTAGLDLDWQVFKLKNGSRPFTIDQKGNISYLLELSPVEQDAEIQASPKSSLKTFLLDIPVNLDLHFDTPVIGKAGARLGGGLYFPLDRYTAVENVREQGNTKYSERITEGKTEKMLWYCKAEIYAGSVGIYYKYCPDSFAPGLDLGNSSLGISLIF